MKTNIIVAIDSEREHQERKNHNHSHTVGEYILILRKVLADAERVWYASSDTAQTMAEIRQVTAVGVKAMEQHGAPLRVPPEMPENEEGEVLPTRPVFPENRQSFRERVINRGLR